jgi:hypothetical protein
MVRATDDGRAQALAREFSQERRTLLQGQLEQIRHAFPDVVADAQRYQAVSHHAPWEFYDAPVFVGEDTAMSWLRAKYGVHPVGSRHRPPVDDVSPLAHLFFEAYDLLFTLAHGGCIEINP